MNAPTRRAAFGVLAGIPALSLPAFAAVFADPVYAAMERHRQAYDTLIRHEADIGDVLDAGDGAGLRRRPDREKGFECVLLSRPDVVPAALIGLVLEVQAAPCLGPCVHERVVCPPVALHGRIDGVGEDCRDGGQ